MLKPERLKEIEALISPGGIDLFKITFFGDLKSAIEDLLIERNQILIPAFKAVVKDYFGLLDAPEDECSAEALGDFYVEEQWEKLM